MLAARYSPLITARAENLRGVIICPPALLVVGGGPAVVVGIMAPPRCVVITGSDSGLGVEWHASAVTSTRWPLPHAALICISWK